MDTKQKIDWSQELENAVARNRIIVDNFYNKQIQKNLEEIYTRLFDNVTFEVRKLFDKANDRGKWLKSDAVKYSRMEGLLLQLGKELQFKNRAVKQFIKKEVSSVYRDDFFELGDILNDFGLLDKTDFFKIKLTPFIKDVLAQDVQGLTYLQRANKITQNEAIQLEEQIKLSQSLGEGIPQTVKRIKNVSNIGKASSVRLAYTTIMAASNVAHLKAYSDIDFIEYVVWSATLDSKTCPICGVQDQRRYKKDRAPALPAHFHCRCSWIPYITQAEWQKRGYNSKSDIGTRIARDPGYTGKGWGKNIRVPAETTWREYFKKLPEAKQKEIIGVGKWNLWNQNKIELEEIAPNRKIVPLKKLKKKAQK